MMSTVRCLENFTLNLTTINESISYFSCYPVKFSIHESHRNVGQLRQKVLQWLVSEHKWLDYLTNHDLTRLFLNHHLVHVGRQILHLLVAWEDKWVHSSFHSVFYACSPEPITLSSVYVKGHKASLDHILCKISTNSSQAAAFELFKKVVRISPLWRSSDANRGHKNELFYLLRVLKSVPAGKHPTHRVTEEDESVVSQIWLLDISVDALCEVRNRCIEIMLGFVIWPTWHTLSQ